MSESRQSWDSLLRTPGPCDHLVHVYIDEHVLVRAIAHFVQSGVEQGEAAVVISIPERIAAVMGRLASVGLTAATAVSSRGGFVAIDARRCLDTFMSGGMPDAGAFRSAITPMLDRLRGGGYRKIRLVGDMVNRLWPHNHV